MALVFGTEPLYAALHQPVFVVVATVLLTSLWPVAAIIVRTFIW